MAEAPPPAPPSPSAKIQTCRTSADQSRAILTLICCSNAARIAQQMGFSPASDRVVAVPDS